MFFVTDLLQTWNRESDDIETTEKVFCVTLGIDRVDVIRAMLRV